MQFVANACIRAKAKAIALSYYCTTAPTLSDGFGVADKLLLSLLTDLRGSVVA